MEFKATHRWKQYPLIKFEVDWSEMKVRTKGDNDQKSTNWTKLHCDRNGIMYFKIHGETVYLYDIQQI